MRLSLLFLLPASFLMSAQAPLTLSPVDQRIEAARKQIEGGGKSFQAYNELAAALCRKGRDTSDVAFYQEAGTAVNRSLELSPGNYDAIKLRVSVLLGEHDFAQALKLAQEINKKGPDDIAGWAFLVDANSGLGNYAEAERDAQWVLDLRQGSALGFEKAAGLRELFGDNQGAIEFYGEALRRTAQSDLDQRAWLLAQKSRLLLASGQLGAAGETLAEAQRLFPGSQFAASVMADLATAKGNYAEAAELFEKCYRTVPSSANLYKWANALEKAGNRQSAGQQFAAFERQARQEIDKPYNANLELIAYYTGRKNDPAEALRIATLESGRRQDCATLAAFAWALYENGKFNEAKTQMDKALAVGVRDPGYFCHAVRISEQVKNAADAARFEKEFASFGGQSCATGGQMEASLGAAK